MNLLAKVKQFPKKSSKKLHFRIYDFQRQVASFNKFINICINIFVLEKAKKTAIIFLCKILKLRIV